MNISKTSFYEKKLSGTVKRRLFFKSMAVAGISSAIFGFQNDAHAQENKGPDQPEAESGHDYTMPRPNAHTEVDFRNGVMGPAMLSLATSQIAVNKASNPKALEFAKFELREAIGVTTVLKGLGTQEPVMDGNATETLQKIKNSTGAAFDKAYIKAQLSNHEFLRDLATSYLSNSSNQTSMAEMHGRNLAMLTLGQFKDHIVLTKDIMKML